MSVIMENVKYGDKRKIEKNEICNFTFHRTHNSNVHKTRCKHPQNRYEYTYPSCWHFERHVWQFPPSRCQYQLRYSHSVLSTCSLGCFGTRVHQEGLRTSEPGMWVAKIPSKWSVSQKFLRHYKMLNQAEWHAQAFRSIQQWSPNKKPSCTV